MLKTWMVLAFGASAFLSAQEGEKWVSVNIGAHKWQSIPQNLDTKTGGGLSGGMWISDRFGIDLKGLYFTLGNSQRNLSKEGLGLPSLLINLNAGGKGFYPYLSIGPGITYLGKGITDTRKIESKVNFHAGLGLMAHVSDHLVTSFEVKAVRTSFNGGSYLQFLGLAGFGYSWGGGNKSVKPSPPPPPPVLPVNPRPGLVPPPEPTLPPPPPPPQVVPQPPPPPPPPPAALPPTPQPVVAVEAPTVPALPAKILLAATALQFSEGKAALGSAGIAEVQKIAATLKGYQGRFTLVVNGFTSTAGKRATNIIRSKRQADAVAKVLIANGVPMAAVKTIGHGPERPLESNATATGRDRNNRIEIDITTDIASKNRK